MSVTSFENHRCIHKPHLGIYETLKLSYLHYSQGDYNDDGSQKQPNVFVLWACGMISGTIGATSVYPLNVIRTRYVCMDCMF